MLGGRGEGTELMTNFIQSRLEIQSLRKVYQAKWLVKRKWDAGLESGGSLSVWFIQLFLSGFEMASPTIDYSATDG